MSSPYFMFYGSYCTYTQYCFMNTPAGCIEGGGCGEPKRFMWKWNEGGGFEIGVEREGGRTFIRKSYLISGIPRFECHVKYCKNFLELKNISHFKQICFELNLLKKICNSFDVVLITLPPPIKVTPHAICIPPPLAWQIA